MNRWSISKIGTGSVSQWLFRALIPCVLGVMTQIVGAQNISYPTHAVTIVVPFAAGGATDITARLIAEGLSKKWGQPVVVENKPGAGGNLGSESVMRASPDGYTLLLGVTGSHSINVSLYKKLRYDPRKDFKAITLATVFPNVIAVNNDIPANNLQELIALAKKNKGEYSYGSDGNGTGSHLGMELLKNQGGFDLTHIPYRGSAPMLIDLMSGEIQVGITGLPAAYPYAKAGKLKILAVTTVERFASAPEYPTVAEQGFPGFAAVPWSGFFVPKDTPDVLVDKISTDLREIMSDETAKQKIVAVGNEFVPTTPKQFQEFVDKEVAKWAEAVRISGVSIE
jgi:tripartite-type tricarboxylate transporter receptor subunit TctC